MLAALFEAMPTWPTLLLVVAGGLCVGSFLNVVIHRLPIMLERAWRNDLEISNGREPTAYPRYNLFVPGSACTNCRRSLTLRDNVPLLSWLLLRGACRRCHAPIAPRYPLVEVLGALLALAAVARFGWTPAALAACGLLWTLLALAWIDADTMLLPDLLTLPLLWAGILFNLSPFGWIALPNAVLGAVVGYLSLWTLFWAFKLIRGKEGMGYGDFKLLGALGAWFGWQMLPLIILLSSLVGAIVGISLMVFARHGRNVPIPFGPYLAAAGLIALFWGKPLTQAFVGVSL